MSSTFDFPKLAATRRQTPIVGIPMLQKAGGKLSLPSPHAPCALIGAFAPISISLWHLGCAHSRLISTGRSLVNTAGPIASPRRSQHRCEGGCRRLQLEACERARAPFGFTSFGDRVSSAPRVRPPGDWAVISEISAEAVHSGSLRFRDVALLESSCCCSVTATAYRLRIVIARPLAVLQRARAR